MKKARVAFYGFPQSEEGFVDAVRALEEHFQVKTFLKDDEDDFRTPSGSCKGVALEIVQFDPHILIIKYSRAGNGLKLFMAIRQQIWVLPVVLTIFAEDASSLEEIQRAGIEQWQVAYLALTHESFADVVRGIKLRHLNK